MSDTVKTTVYLQVRPEYARWVSASQRDKPASIDGAKVVSSTQNKSSRPQPGTVEVKLTIELPKRAFMALTPEAVVVIPDSLTQPHPVQVEALDANESEVE